MGAPAAMQLAFCMKKNNNFLTFKMKKTIVTID